METTVKDYLRLMRMDKPIGILLLLWPTLWALLIAAHGHPPLRITFIFVIGVFLTRSAGCIFNDIADVKFDGKVTRTSNRPLVRGVISLKRALILAVGLSLCAFILAGLLLKFITVLLTIPALFLMLTYPYMKRFMPIPQAYLGIAFSFSIPMVFIEITGTFLPAMYILFAANFFWVFGYDTVYALADKLEDINIGVKSTALSLGKYVGWFIALCYFTFLATLCGLGFILNLTNYYFVFLGLSALLLVYQIAIAYHLADNQTTSGIRNEVVPDYIRLFKLNNWVGMLICIGLFLSYNR